MIRGPAVFTDVPIRSTSLVRRRIGLPLGLLAPSRSPEDVLFSGTSQPRMNMPFTTV